MEFEELKKMLTVSDNIDIVKRLGVKDILPLEDKEGFICETICHNLHGGSHKLYYYHEDKLFVCYSQCGSMDIIELVNKAKRYGSVSTASKYITTQLGIDVNSYGFNTAKESMISDWEFIDSMYEKKRTSSIMELQEFDIRPLNTLQNIYSQEWIDDHISIETMIKYNIQYDCRQQQIVIPHYDEKGRLIGVRGRNLNEEYADLYGKYLPYRDFYGEQYNHPLSLNMFGIDKNMEAIKRSKKIMIVEGEKSCMQCDSYFRDDNFTVALCGKNLSNWQINKIIDLGVEEVIIALDKQFPSLDSIECTEWAKYIRERIIKPLAPYMKVYILWDEWDILGYKDSPCDKGKEVLLEMMKRKKYVGTF